MSGEVPKRPDKTRESLFIRLRPGDPGREVAWAVFFRLYAPMISGFARRLGARGSQVDDLVTDVLGAFYSTSPEFVYDPSKGRFRGYLMTCVLHKFTQLRKKAEREAKPFGDHVPVDPRSIEETWNDVWETTKLQQAMEAVRERYSTNPERQRTFQAFEMCAVLDRPTSAVAAALGMSEEGVRAARSRVAKALRQTFDHLDTTTG